MLLIVFLRTINYGRSGNMEIKIRKTILSKETG